MNNINEIVFRVYNGVLDMNYSKNDYMTIMQKIKQIYRYVVSGYMFKLKKK